MFVGRISAVFVEGRGYVFVGRRNAVLVIRDRDGSSRFPEFRKRGNERATLPNEGGGVVHQPKWSRFFLRGLWSDL